MRTEALNGLKKGDRVKRVNSHRSKWKHLVDGKVDDISMSEESVYVTWYDEDGKSFHWAKYNCHMIEKIEQGE
ncbi:hypothetical protein [Brevibacillus borstelensis]|uniref:hypothetical protein n=1 Tax=Brevibacillus borstelensis TaxID=45462 RepID=UPI0030F728FD